MKKRNWKLIGIKMLLVPVYALFVCAVMYLAGDMKDIWPRWSAWVDRKFGENGSR